MSVWLCCIPVFLVSQWCLLMLWSILLCVSDLCLLCLCQTFFSNTFRYMKGITTVNVSDIFSHNINTYYIKASQCHLCCPNIHSWLGCSFLNLFMDINKLVSELMGWWFQWPKIKINSKCGWTTLQYPPLFHSTSALWHHSTICKVLLCDPDLDEWNCFQAELIKLNNCALGCRWSVIKSLKNIPILPCQGHTEVYSRLESQLLTVSLLVPSIWT